MNFRTATRHTDSKPGSAARARIVMSANELFYAEGFRAVSVDRIVGASNVTRVTFYRHFPSKDHLIKTYLESRLATERAALAELRAASENDPRATLASLVATIVAELASPGFRGCPYQNFAAEFADSDHPARGVVSEHGGWLFAELEALLGESKHPRSTEAAGELVLLRAGAMALASTDFSEKVADVLNVRWSTIVTAGTDARR